jgi:hypothetical protein
MINIEIDVQQSINAAYDSVNLVNQLITEELNQEKKSTIKRNVEHLEIMLGKDFFVEGLTPTQKVEIETCISQGHSYIS